MIVNSCIENVKSYVMIGKSCIEIWDEIIIVFEIWDEIWIGIEILLLKLSSIGLNMVNRNFSIFTFNKILFLIPYI